MLQPDSLTVERLFSTHRVFRAPVYQRSYVWDAEKHWEPLWGDLRSVADRIASAGSRLDDLQPHFLGAIVVQQERISAARIPSFSIIDGQQRLTTLQIIFVAIRDLASALSVDDIRQQLGELTQNPTAFQSEDAHKIWPTNSDRSEFLRLTQGEIDPGKGKLSRAYSFFAEKFRDFCLTEAMEITPVERVRILARCIRQFFSMVVITLSENDDPHMIFEALNARGEPLLPSDLIRNLVFSSAMPARVNTDALYNKYWADYDKENFWKETVRSGRFEVARLDTFFSAYLSSVVRQEIPYSRLYAEFRNWWGLSPSAAEIERRLTLLKERAKLFVVISKPNDGAPLIEHGHWIAVLGIVAALPITLAVLSDENLVLSRSDVAGIVTDLQSFLVRRAVCKLPTGAYSRFFTELLKDAYAERPINREWMQDRLTASSHPARRWPDDAEFQKSWLSAPQYDELRTSTIKAILLAIDERLRTDRTESVVFDTSKLSVEHIMPQKWTMEEYPLLDTTDREKFRRYEEERKRIIHSFGNLTLLTGQLNKDVGNGSFKIKKRLIANQSALRLNNYFQNLDENVIWDHSAIEQRGKILFAYAIDVWPHPGRGATLSDVRQSLFLPKSSPIAALKFVEKAQHFQITVTEIHRVASEKEARDLRRLGLIDAEGFVFIPKGLVELGAAECLAHVLEQQETVAFARSMLEHNPKLLSSTLGASIAARYGLQWAPASQEKYGGHLLTWVKWADRVRTTVVARSGHTEYASLAENPEYWAEQTVKRGRRQIFNDRGWAAALEVWYDCSITSREAARRIGVAKSLIYQYIRRNGLPGRPDVNQASAHPSKEPGTPRTSSTEERETTVTPDPQLQGLLPMWHNPKYTVKQIAESTGVAVRTLYTKLGPRGTPQFGGRHKKAPSGP